MTITNKKSTGNLPSEKTARFGKKLERIVVVLVGWMLSLTFPIWIYGMVLAIGKGEFRPIAAMIVLIVVSGFCVWFRIIKQLKTKMSSGKTISVVENKS